MPGRAVYWRGNLKLLPAAMWIMKGNVLQPTSTEPPGGKEGIARVVSADR